MCTFDFSALTFAMQTFKLKKNPIITLNDVWSFPLWLLFFPVPITFTFFSNYRSSVGQNTKEKTKIMWVKR